MAENGSGMFDATYGPIGASHFTGSPAQFHQAMLDAGIRYEADGDTTVWRAATDRQAGVFAEQMARLLSSAHGYIPDAAPTGLPVAHCFHKDTEDGRDFYCLLTVGRYVARTYAIDDQRDSWQRTAAQYLILTDADQKVTDR